MSRALNMLQSNIQYIATVVGFQANPFLALDTAFCDHFVKRQFKFLVA